MNSRILFILVTSVLLPAPAQQVRTELTVHITTPMAPPAWALLERDLLKYNSLAVEEFAAKFIDERGYLLHTPRWGTLDGPDDAIETYWNWTLLHALGGSGRVLDLYKKGQEGHWRQYGELRTKLTTLAAYGAYSKEFITQSDWFHTGEGMRAFLLQGLSDPNNQLYRERVKRFAAMYDGDDPEAPNYDKEKKILKSIWTGSKGPMLHKATTYDWVGDPVPGTFNLLHNPAGRGAMLDLESHYKKMLSHCDEYLDSTGDNFLNLASNILGLDAYALTGDEKYRQWVLDYVGAWKQRAAEAGGNIPSNIGLDGKLGGEYNGQWWKGTYGWNFTIFDGELGQVAHRNYFTDGSWPGFGTALLLSGDQSFVDTLRKQMDNLYTRKKVENGQTLLPQMYGDPRGYKFNGPPQWYHYTNKLYTDRLTEIYLWSMDRKDLERLPVATSFNENPGRGGYGEPDRTAAWLGFLEGQFPGFPEKALQSDLARVRQRVEMIHNDRTTADSRLADYLLDFNPATTNALTSLTLGGYFSSGRIWVLHSRFRYFDPVNRRAGLPADVGALVERLGADSATVTLVNTNPIEAREVVIQAGGYGEHRFEAVTVAGRKMPYQGPVITVRLDPGAGSRLEFQMTRYANRPTFAFPWDRGWYPAR
ncbi:hypothetical protein [uncultured Paludibaculum sp.]|uniref:hypothetical protein n=1 Tax=uncultured Paludibaculum sp. TaxID=1765020 RepID=UPI002AAB2205|nr:hypothetical protein [uncultured Paludibaculum sp.]